MARRRMSKEMRAHLSRLATERHAKRRAAAAANGTNGGSKLTRTPTRRLTVKPTVRTEPKVAQQPARLAQVVSIYDQVQELDHSQRDFLCSLLAS